MPKVTNVKRDIALDPCICKYRCVMVIVSNPISHSHSHNYIVGDVEYELQLRELEAKKQAEAEAKKQAEN